MMPKKNGFDVCNAVKNELGLGPHPHYFADGYMTKPFDPDALIAKARSVLGLSTPGV
jgi:two-component system alkaline phosphatase synthesis response regulator PhoP